MIRIKDIAEKAGVSPTTVSNVIHGNTKRVSAETIGKIQRILEENNYVPSMAARLLSRNSSNIIGVIITYTKNKTRRVVQDPFISEILGALEEEIRSRGYFMMLYAAEETMEVFKLASTWNVAGLIILGFSEKDCVNLGKQTDTPFVTIDSYFDTYKNRFVNIGLSDYEGGLLMGRHLADYGHSRILFLSDNDYGVDHFRWLGFCQAMQERGLVCEKERRLILCRDDGERSRQYVQILPRLKQQTALFFASDYYAVECINYLKEQKIRVPEDISVAGFDDNILAEIVRPRLTTVRQEVSRKAEAAIDSLLKLLEGKAEEITERDIKLPVELISRDSVAKL